MFTRDTIDDAYVLETERLEIRWPRLADAGLIERLAGDQAVAETTALIPHPYPPGAAGEYIFAARLANAEGTGLVLVITPRRKPREVMGVIGLHTGDRPEPFIGYWLGRAFWGRGYATEASCAMVDTLFKTSDASGLTSDVRITNPASRRVLEKCGFCFEGTSVAPFPARGGLLPVNRMRLGRSAWECRMLEREEQRKALSPCQSQRAMGARILM